MEEGQGARLVGREREQAELRGLLTRGRVVHVWGAAGVGKTSLVLEVCRAAACDRVIAPVVHLSLSGAFDARDALARTARSMSLPRPAPGRARIADALSVLLARAPRTLVWDDLDHPSAALAEIVEHFAVQEHGPGRLVLVSRTCMTVRKASRTSVYEVQPLSHQGAVALVRALEAERGRTLADDLAAATAGNPLLLRVALAEAALPRASGNATDALRRSVERARGAARKVLAVLAAAEAPLDEGEIVRAVGKGAREAIDDFREHLVVVRNGPRLAIAAPVLSLAQETLGEPDAATWRALGKLADRALATSGHDGSALLLAARAHLALGDVDGSLATLRAHAVARAAAPTAALERLLREVASQAPGHAPLALRLLARELLRVGDYESARRALDELPAPKTRHEGERVALLRAESHIGAGEPAAAQRALDSLDRPTKKAQLASPGVVLTRAQLAILRGELAPARAMLEELAPRSAEIPQLEARRAVEIAASYLYEERYESTHVWTSRARAAQKAGGIPVERVVTILDVHALLGLGEVDRAEELLAREARGGPDGPLHIAALVRRGELSRALELGDAAIALLDRRADLIYRSALARDLARACLGTGQLARADRMLRLAETAGAEPGLAALGPICDAERARLAEAEGDLARATRSIERAYAQIPRSPFVAIDRDVMTGTTPSRAPARGEEELPPVARAYASLRSAELALVKGALEPALEDANLAERYYATAGLWHETARARVAGAEALVRSHGEAKSQPERAAIRDRALQALEGCEEIASPHGYVPVVVACAILRAALDESTGDLAGTARAIEGAVLAARDGIDAALARAAQRLGVTAREPRGSGPRPYAARIERLGLVRSADVVWRVGPRTYLREREDGPPEPVSCTVDIDARRLFAGGGRELDLAEQRLALLSALADSGGGGASLEEIFGQVWGGTFHPLRHRNAVYVALARLKESLKPFASDVTITHEGDRYRLAGQFPVAVRRMADPDAVRSAVRGGAPAPGQDGPGNDPSR